MRCPKITRLLPFAAAVFLLAGIPARAQQLTTLYAFTNGADGTSPMDAPLIVGTDGNLYGTAYSGGTGKYGTVFQLTPAGVFTTLHSFTDGADGGLPFGGVVEGAPGTFYGTTGNGGDSNEDGVVYSVTSGGVFTTLHTFSEYPDGAGPHATLVRDANGNFYGATEIDGPGNIDTGMDIYGTVFQITPSGGFTTVYAFNAGNSGSSPSDLVLGTDGNLYGIANDTGANESGTIFQLTPGGGLTTLYALPTANQYEDSAKLTQGSDGNLYGATSAGGANGNGMIFKITTTGAFTDLYDFSPLSGGTNSDGAAPWGGVIEGSDGNFYGTASAGGPHQGGTVYRITATGVFTTLYAFEDGTDGSTPKSALVQDSSGNLYGTTEQGGAGKSGTIFKLALGANPAHPAFFTGETALANGVYYLAFPNGNYFGYYSYLTDPAYIYHFDLGYEYVFDANDGNSGVYFYDFASNDFFYTSPNFPFPYLYDFGLNSTVYYYPDPNNPGHYNTNGIRYFYVFNTGEIIAK